MTLVRSGTLHLWVAQASYCNLDGSHLSAHFPEPSAGVLTMRSLLLVPPSQSLEQLVHFVQGWSSQSFSQASTLHCFDCPVLPHCLPPCAAGVFTSRTRLAMPPPHLEEHLLQ